MLKNKIYGVILAAGKGERIIPLSFENPKPLLPICNKPIIQYQIESMKELGITDFIIVVGHLKERIQAFFGNGSSLGVRIKYVEQKEKLGIAHAIGQLETHIDAPFLLFLGDIFFVPKNLDTMLKIFQKKNAGAILAVKKESDPNSIRKNFTVMLAKKGNRVIRVIEKPRYLNTNLKGCGIYLFDLAIFDAIRNTPRTAMRDEYEITTAIQILIEEGASVFTADVIEWDMNVTVPADLLKCNQMWLKKTKSKNSIDPTAKINQGSRIINSVIGKNVRIDKPITVKDSVIMDGIRIKSNKNLINALISKNFTATFKDSEIKNEI